MIQDAKKLLAQAKSERKAIPAFNVSSMEAVQAVFEGAREEKSIVIIEASKGEIEYWMPELLPLLCEKLAGINKVSYVLHLDRCNDLDLMKRCLKAGFNSVSAEFGLNSYQENLKKTLAARKLTDKFGAALEAVMEIVPLVYYEKQKQIKFTDPKKAERFAGECGCDSLVVSIGNQSGRHKQLSYLRFDILEEINKRLPQMPLVLHGGSFIKKETVKTLINLGISKINFNSELRIASSEKLRSNLDLMPKEYAPYKLMSGVKEEIKKVIKNKIKICQNY